MGRGDLLEYFKFNEKKENKDLTTFVLEPKKESTELIKISIVINSKEKTIHEISYLDNLENVSKFSFSNPQFDRIFDADLFKYKPPKKAYLTEIN